MKIDTRKLAVRPMTHAHMKAVLRASSWKRFILTNSAFPDTAAIDTIGVHPDFQPTGVAYMLLDEYKSYARAAGVNRVHTLVDWNDCRPIHFFDSVGFSPSRTLSLEAPT